ncbi:MAG: F0F1 ATP synthase subunit delta [Planctomycetes bacterium]|nr:F0F1 ATP synthase subunit delta [Planctomycetota bacterium]
MELRDTIILVIGFVVVAGILVALLRMVLAGQSNTAIERLKRINQDNLQRELELKKKLDEAEAQYQRRLSEATGDIQKMKEKMEDEVGQMKQKVVAAAEKEKEGILSDARQEVADLKNELTLASSQRIAGFAQEVINKLLAGATDSDKIAAGLHQYFIDEAVKRIRSMKKEMLASALALPGQAGSHEIEVSSRLALTAHQKQALNEAFSEASSKAVKIVEKPANSKYLAGVSIKIGNLVVDATLSNRLKEIVAEITKS